MFTTMLVIIVLGLFAVIYLNSPDDTDDSYL